jgi:hypothetical protein
LTKNTKPDKSNFNMNDASNVGIKQQIQVADSISKIESLLAKVRGFSRAHPSTVRKCEREAKKRIAFLNIPMRSK